MIRVRNETNMSPQMLTLLLMVPEARQAELTRHLPTIAQEAIVREAEEIDEATILAIAEAVWRTLEAAE